MRSRSALNGLTVRYRRLGALVFRPDSSLDKSLRQPFCGVETDSSLGGLGDRTCWWPEERLRRGHNFERGIDTPMDGWLLFSEHSEAVGSSEDGFIALVLYPPGGCAQEGSVFERSPTWRYRVLKAALRLRPRRALSSASGQKPHVKLKPLGREEENQWASGIAQVQRHPRTLFCRRSMKR